MKTTKIPHPPIVSEKKWLAKRKKLLVREKELTQRRDRVNARRRRLPMVKMEKDYLFDGPRGRQNFKELFDGRRQLILYHFMFDPAWDKGCPRCTGFVDALGDLSMLKDHDTTFALVSRAPQDKLQVYQAQRGWTIPWYSSFGSDFNYDFHTTQDAKISPIEYNFLEESEMKKKMKGTMKGEQPGLSVFFLLNDEVYHTYSAYARGLEALTDAYMLLDTTPYGRQQDFEDSPRGWPQKPTYG